MTFVVAVLFGDSCRVDSHCDVEGALCVAGLCECRDPTARPTTDKTVCVKTNLKALGEVCSAPADCKGKRRVSVLLIVVRVTNQD